MIGLRRAGAGVIDGDVRRRSRAQKTDEIRVRTALAVERERRAGGELAPRDRSMAGAGEQREGLESLERREVYEFGAARDIERPNQEFVAPVCADERGAVCVAQPRARVGERHWCREIAESDAVRIAGLASIENQ